MKEQNGDAEMICLNDRTNETMEAVIRANDDLKVFPARELDTYTVVNFEKKSDYEVRLTTIRGMVLASCKCGDFQNRNRVCKHIAVVLRRYTVAEASISNN